MVKNVSSPMFWENGCQGIYCPWFEMLNLTHVLKEDSMDFEIPLHGLKNFCLTISRS